MDFDDGKRAIARIYSVLGEVAGVGFLVADRYVLTCAHVVQACLNPQPGDDVDCTGETITLTLPFATGNQQYQTQVVFYALGTGVANTDVAILYMATDVSIFPLPRATLSDSNFIDFKTFGFPSKDGELGQNRSVLSRGGVVGGWVQIDCPNSTGGEIEKGFSGAPVWCPTRKAVVGMVVARDPHRPGEKIAFMVPMKALDRALEFIQRHSLLAVLESEQQQLSDQIAIAYEVCRPINWSKPYQTQLEQRLDDLARMTAGELKEPMLVQFVACLLNQIPESMGQELQQWLEQWALSPENLDSLRVSLLDKSRNRQSVSHVQTSESPRPYLIVSVEESEGRDNPYKVRASLIRDVACYDPRLASGAEPLVFQADVDTYPDSQDLDPEDGVPKDKLPVLLACYLDQVGARNIDIQQLIVELWLPMSLVNEPIEQQPIPTQLGFDQFLAQECGQVMVRLQDRLKETRMLGRWQTKWQRLRDVLQDNAGFAFVPGTGNVNQIYRSLRPDHVLGLRLTRKPQTEKIGELGALIGTGTPTALWVRQEESVMDWESQFSQQIFGCTGGGMLADAELSEPGCCLSCPDASSISPDSGSRSTGCRSISLADLPQQVATVRRNAPDIDEDSPLEQSVELGHHLAFLWEDPNRVPPVSPYFSHDKL
jgi:hypothetical protein